MSARSWKQFRAGWRAGCPFGSGSNALVLAKDGQTLYVANGTNNCVAVVRLGTKAGARSNIR